MPFLLKLAWQDLRASGRSLWVFCACLTLGVTLIAASGGLYQLVNQGLLADTRALLGGDLEVDANQPLSSETLSWMTQNGEVSLVTEVDTMLGTPAGQFARVELQSMDARYPLYGELRLQPDRPLQSLLAKQNGQWGVALDPVLADRLKLSVGDTVLIGNLEMAVRAKVLAQPDRSLNANWRGTPVLLSNDALKASGLIQPGSRIEYDYRVKTSQPAEQWREQFYAQFPQLPWEVRTFADRSQRIAERLAQIASGLLIIGFSTLFIGGLGVFNSIQAYLQNKLKTIATLRAVGLRNGSLATVYLLQVAMLSIGSSLLGAVLGALLAVSGIASVAAEVPLQSSLAAIAIPLLSAIMFGVLTAFCFALPVIGRAVHVSPAALFRGDVGMQQQPPRQWGLLSLGCGGLLAFLVLLSMPDIRFGLGFMTTVATLLLLLDVIVKLIRKLARILDDHPVLNQHFALRLALANLHRPGSALRASLLSLGSALTLLVACTLIVSALLHTLSTTLPEESPALVLYDVLTDQREDVSSAIRAADSFQRLDLAPLVRGRIATINDVPLSEKADLTPQQRQEAARDEHKFSYSANNIDGVNVIDGQWWNESNRGENDLPQVAVEDHEAVQIGLQVGDRISFAIEGRQLDAQVAAIYSQKGVQTRFWFEAIFSDGALDSFIHRYVGAAYMDASDAISSQTRVAATAPNIITVRTAEMVDTAQQILGKASGGLAVVAAVSLLASFLVLVSVMAAGRSRQVYTATVLQVMGTRLSVIRRSLYLEYLVLAIITTLFAVLLGSAIAYPLLNLRMKIPAEGFFWLGSVVAAVISIGALSLGAQYLLRRLQLKPALLLRSE